MAQITHKFIIGLAAIGVLAVLVAGAVAAIILKSARRENPTQLTPEALSSQSEVRANIVVQKHAHVIEPGGTSASYAIDILCGANGATDNRYEARNDALLSIARRRDLPADDVAVLMDYVASTCCVMRIEREAALKNDVLNLLHNQKRQPEGLADLLADMVASEQYSPVIIDYCIQHLGVMANSVADDAMRARIRETFVAAARNTNEPYAGTALYSLAELPPKSKDESDELHRLTVGLCNASANQIARIAAIQLAGERGCRETLPMLRGILAGTRRDAVLDMAVVGSVGLMGDANDVQLLESFRARGGRRLNAAIDAAVRRIKERHSANQTKR